MSCYPLMIATANFALGLATIAMAQDTMATEIQVSQKETVGDYLTDSKGRSLYLFEADKGKGASTCYDACAKAWPPVTAANKQASAGDKIDASKLGTVKRKDGSTQITYGGWPLYYYAEDQQPGDIKGQDIEQFGAEWYLITTVGEKAEGES